MKNRPGCPNDEDRTSVIQSKKLQNVYLSKPMPVMLMYWTCYENQVDGRIYFFRDACHVDVLDLL
jgi:murein L,D-transpeptidase YcbB/YkuD